MDINEITMWVSHAGTSLGVNGDAYGAKMLGEAVESLRARLAEVEKEIADRQEVEKGLREWLVRDGEKIEALEARLAEVEAQRDGFIAAIENCINYAASRETEWGSRAVGAFQYLYDALEIVEEK